MAASSRSRRIDRKFARSPGRRLELLERITKVDAQALPLMPFHGILNERRRERIRWFRRNWRLLMRKYRGDCPRQPILCKSEGPGQNPEMAEVF
jgi:hypothetical protein